MKLWIARLSAALAYRPINSVGDFDYERRNKALLAVLFTHGQITTEDRDHIEEVEALGLFDDEVLWVNMDDPDMEELRAKYAVKKELAPFILTFDLGLPVFGEEFTFKTPKHLSYGSDVVPRIAQEQEEHE
jgi:hypothetical protein